MSQLTESEGIQTFKNVLDIIINYDKAIKKDINLSITKLLTPIVEKNSFIVFETNAAEDISIITTDYFNINQNKNQAMNCLFKKGNNQKNDKLLLLCNADSSGVYKFDISETVLKDLNILYSFKILETHINENVTVLEEEGTKIKSVYPDLLDFTSVENIIIKYQTENPDKLKNIKLNINSNSSLNCNNKNGYKECIILKSHFNESGYYYTYYNNSLNANIVSCEIPKIQVILEKKDEGKSDGEKEDENPRPKNLVGIIVGSVVGGIVLIAVIVIIIICIKKRKANLSEFNDKIGNILPNSEKIELTEGNKF